MKTVLRAGGCAVLFLLFLTSYAIAQVEVFKEDFEGQFPGAKWTLGDFNSQSGLDYWRDRAGIAYNGSWVGWCAEVGDSAGISNSFRGTYDNYMDAFMQASFNLSSAYSATIEFWYYIPSIDVGYDNFAVEVSADGFSWQQIFFTSTTTYNWSYFSYSLSGYLNDPSVYVRFLFHSDNIITAEGVFVDDIRVTKICEPADQLFSGSSVQNNVDKKYSYNQFYNFWSVTGVRPPSSSDWDIQIYGDACFTPESLKATSELGTGSVDFVVANYNIGFAPTGNDFIKVYQYSGGGTFRAEWEDGGDQFFPPVVQTLSWNSSNVVKGWDVYMSTGQQLYFTVDVPGTSIDPGLALFRPNANQHYFRRADAVLQANSAGAGQRETFSYTAITSGYHCLVLWSNNEASGNYTIRIESTPPCPVSEQLLVGNPFLRNTNPGRYYYNHSSTLWSIIGIRPPSSSDWNLGLFSDACYSIHKKSSLQGAGLVDFVMSSRNNPTGLYYPLVNFVTGNASENYKVEWWDGDIFPSSFSISQNWFGNVVRAWDVQLTGGVKYYFGAQMKNGVFSDFDPGAALFGPSTGSEFYAERGVAVATANSAPAQQSEISSYTPTTTGNYVLVVWSNNEGTGNYYPIAHRKGDTNGDGALTVADVVLALNCIFDAPDDCLMSVTDMNCSGTLTPADAVSQLQLIFRGVPPPC